MVVIAAVVVQTDYLLPAWQAHLLAFTNRYFTLDRNPLRMSGLEGQVRTYIAENFVLAADAGSLPGDASLTRGGIVDSVGVVELIHFLETHFGIEIADEDLVPENIDTIDNIVRYVGTKRTSDAAPTVLHDDARV